MNSQQAAEYWNQNAEAWTAMSRAGYDVYRDYLNTPAFFSMLPPIDALIGLDIGCGEGHNTRLLAGKGAIMTAIDVSENFIRHARDQEIKKPAGIEYVVGSATTLPFKNDQFDFATSFMCLMDLPEPKLALMEAMRVIKPGGFFQFSITHPCFNNTPHRKNLRNAAGETYAIEVGGYFRKEHGRIDQWSFGAAPFELKKQYAPFRVPLFNFTLTEWFDFIRHPGFELERIQEPCPTPKALAEQPSLQDAQVVAYFLHLLCRKRV